MSCASDADVSLYFLCVLGLSSAHACVGPVPKADPPHHPKVPVSRFFWENYCFK